MFTEETPRACGEDGTSDPDGYMILVIDPATGHGDCFGPYATAAAAQEQAFWRRLEYDVADLPDVLIGVVPWHAEGDGPSR
ncbi:hypothetical protein [Actinomycetospora chiangmaiensis]|uniref:hypothetical protein n=1 Tax=Actinomycetospora chiangmaiensis TaxID=402650 RepID=UPI00039F2A03|nr:hypothetical protein [Actinomycetospora chiangmaiensis]